MRDPKLRAALTPDYTIGCKRILISNDYYPAVAAPNAELVTAGIAEVRPHSIVDRDGVERPTDTIVLATGFHVTDLPIAEKISGRDGHTLAEEWADGMVSNRSATVAGFPNLFLLVGPERRRRPHVDGLHDRVAGRPTSTTPCRPWTPRASSCWRRRRQAQQAYRDLIAEKSRGTVWLAGGCASWYLDKQGHNTTLWPDFTFRFRKLTRTLDRENYVGTPADAPAPHLGGGRVSTARHQRRTGACSGRHGSPPSATSDGAVLHATIDGSDDAPVTLVLAHGWTLAQAAWDDVADLLRPAGRRRRAAPDPVRPARPRPLHLGRRRESLDRPARRRPRRAARPARPHGAPSVLGGHSMGGMTIMCLAAARPELFGDRVRGVALVSTSAGDLDPEPRTPRRASCSRSSPRAR